MYGQGGAYARLVVEELLHGHVVLVGVAQAGDVVGGEVGELEEAEVVGFHHAGKRAEGF